MGDENPQAGSEQEQEPGQEPTSPGEGTPPEGDQEQGAAQPQAAGTVDELPEWAQELIGDLRKENATHRKAKKAAEKQAQEAEEARLAEEKKFQELAEKRAQERDEALARLAAKELELLKREVAQVAGLPAELAERLQGETREELEADAEALKKLMPPPSEEGRTPGAPAGPKRSGKSTPEVKSPGIRL